MGLRDDNPMIDSDLDLIITAFEKSMVKSRDIDSVFVPFRREISAFASYPKSVVESIDGVPLPSESEEGSSASSSGGAGIVPAVVSSPELTAGDPNTPVEDGDDEEGLTDKIKDWVTECIPCTGEFKRTISSMDADFFKEIGFEWDRALDETWDKLTDFELLLDGNDPTRAFCDMAGALKGQCTTDLKKMLFIFNVMLSRIEVELSIDLSILDTFLMAALSPLFNGLAANLDLIASLALDPLRCVLDYMQFQVNNKARLAGEARAAIIDPTRRQIQEQRARMNAALRSPVSVSVTSTSRRPPSEAERAARRAQQEQMRIAFERQSGQQMASATQRANQAFERTREALDYLDRFQEYLTCGVDYLEDKKNWLLGLIEEFINDSLDRWNDKMSFAQNKTEMLTMTSILSAMIETSKGGGITCGPESGGLSQEDVQRIVRHWVHPSESLEITVDGDNIVTRRRPGEQAGGEGVFTDGEGVFTGGEGPDSTAEDLPNVVVRRPISSCLKKITTDEAEQVQYWIRQLEQEV